MAFIPLAQAGSALITELGLTLADATSSFQRKYIEQAVERSGGNMSRAAEGLGLHRSNLYRKMRQLGMPSPD